MTTLTTNGSGQVPASCTDVNGPGLDIIRASGSIDGEDFSCGARTTWEPPDCVITPAIAGVEVGTRYDFRVDVTDFEGNPIPSGQKTQ